MLRHLLRLRDCILEIASTFASMGSRSETQIMTTSASEPLTFTADSSVPETITAQNVRLFFPGVEAYRGKSGKPPVNESEPKTTDDSVLKGYANDQVKHMAEPCIILDVNDAPIGRADKMTCTSHVLLDLQTRVFTLLTQNLQHT